MPREISGLRIARSFVTPAGAEVSRELDFQLGARQGIAIHQVIGTTMVGVGGLISAATQASDRGVQTLHLETGSLETVPDLEGEDEDTIDSEIFYRQDYSRFGNDDVTTEFRASAALLLSPNDPVAYPQPILTARNITHRGITSSSNNSALFSVIILYTFVEFSLSELGLILARRT